MDLTKGKEKAGELLFKAGDGIRNFFAALKQKCAPLTEKIAAAADSILDRFPEEKRRPILFASGGLVALLFIVIIASFALNFRGPRQSTAVDIASGPHIPPEEFFIPAEPDFIPDFIFEREPRHSWTLEDVRPYWRNPGDPELWRSEVRSAVDRLMDGVP